MATKTRLATLALTLALGAGCGAGGGRPEGRLASDVAAGLAARAEQVASALDAGRCDEALAGARSLQTDIAALPADVDAEVRAEALAGAARLVNGISCPAAVIAPPTTVPAPVITMPAEPRPKGKKHKGDDNDD